MRSSYPHSYIGVWRRCTNRHIAIIMLSINKNTNLAITIFLQDIISLMVMVYI